MWACVKDAQCSSILPACLSDGLGAWGHMAMSGARGAQDFYQKYITLRRYQWIQLRSQGSWGTRKELEVKMHKQNDPLLYFFQPGKTAGLNSGKRIFFQLDKIISKNQAINLVPLGPEKNHRRSSQTLLSQTAWTMNWTTIYIRNIYCLNQKNKIWKKKRLYLKVTFSLTELFQLSWIGLSISEC